MRIRKTQEGGSQSHKLKYFNQGKHLIKLLTICVSIVYFMCNLKALKMFLTKMQIISENLTSFDRICSNQSLFA